MMARASYEKAVRSVVLVALGFQDAQLIFTEEAGPHLKGAFATINVAPPRGAGSAVTNHSAGPPETYTIRKYSTGTARVQVFGDDARDRALDMVARLERDPAITDAEYAAGVSVTTASGIAPQELAPVRDTGFERRTVVELFYTLTRNTEVQAEAIENYEITSNIET